MEEGGVGGRPVEGRMGVSMATIAGISRGLRNIVGVSVSFKVLEDDCHFVASKEVQGISEDWDL